MSFRLSTVLLTSLLFGIGSFAFAQNDTELAGTAQTLPYLVAFVDIAQIIQEHPDFAQKQAMIQQRMQQEEKNFEEWQKRLEAKEKNLGQLKPESPEYKKTRTELTKEYNDLKNAFKKKELDFLREHVKMTYELYQEIRSEIASFATQRNIAHVVNMTSSEVNIGDADSVDNEINKTTVWCDPRLNVTKYILAVCYSKRGKKYAGDTPQKSSGVVPVAYQ